jgi:hypothetical protein
VTRHVEESHRSLLVASVPVSDANASHSAGVDRALDARASCHSQKIACSVHVRFVKILWTPRPQPIVCGDMKDSLTTPYSSRQAGRIPQIPHDGLHIQPIDSPPASNQSTHIIAALKKLTGHMPADKTCSASHEKSLQRTTTRKIEGLSGEPN